MSHDTTKQDANDGEPHAAQARRYEPYPLTDLQEAYWIGRQDVVELGGVSTHRYLEIDCDDVDIGLLGKCWRRLIDRHDVLRTVISRDGCQRVLPDVPRYSIAEYRLDHLADAVKRHRLAAIRRRLSHQVLPANKWPLFEICASRLGGGNTRIHISLDRLIVDAASQSRLFNEWSQLYNEPDTKCAPVTSSFRDFVIADSRRKKTDSYRRDRQYWLSQLPSLHPAPTLPLVRNPNTAKKPYFTSLRMTLDADHWQRLKHDAERHDIRPTAVLLTAFAAILDLYANAAFTLNVTIRNPLARSKTFAAVIGDVTSTMLLPVDLSNDADFACAASTIEHDLKEKLTYSSFNGVEVIREWIQSRADRVGALFPVVFTSMIGDDQQSAGADDVSWLGDQVFTISQTPQVVLDHQVRERDGALAYNWDIVSDLYPDGLAEEMIAAYHALLSHLSCGDCYWRESLSTVRGNLVKAAEWSAPCDKHDTNAVTPETLLHSGFVVTATKQAERPALTVGYDTLSYRRLLTLANGLASRICEYRYQPGSLIAIEMEKSWEQVVSVLGILMSGNAYVPIDRRLPQRRRELLIAESGAAMVLVQAAFPHEAPAPAGVDVIVVDTRMSSAPEPNRQATDTSHEDLAYIIYTSGSTGTPKGVMIQHKAVVNTILDINHRFDITSDDRIFGLSSLSFDLSVYDIFGAFAAGAELILPNPEDPRNPAEWAALIVGRGVTVWNSVPALMVLLVEYVETHPELQPLPLRLVLLSGDWIPLDLADRIRRLTRNVTIVSLGGATEASIWSISHVIDGMDRGISSVPYGTPLKNQTIYVCKHDFTPCPTWVPGEIYIGGAGLASGYLNDERKTRKAFTRHPVTGERLYRTGDFGRYLPDGLIEFLGREDSQVKIRGYRVELGEITETLQQHPAVATAALDVIGDRDGDKRLVAYITTTAETHVNTEEIRRFASQRLPEYMVPGVFRIVPDLPLTINGKIDRRALASTSQETSTTTIAHDMTAEAGRVAEMVSEILNMQISDDTLDLFACGLTSIGMMRLARKIEFAFGTAPKMASLFRLRTVRDIVAHLRHIGQEDHGASLRSTGVPVDSQPLPLLLDPAEREKFRRSGHGLRRPAIAYIRPEISTTGDIPGVRQAGTRKSDRHFGPLPTSPTAIWNLLSCLRARSVDGRYRYHYGSAGGLYPVQTYLTVCAGGISGIPDGAYYYHPVEHALESLHAGTPFGPEIYGLPNRPVFECSAFGLFLIADLKAIAPIYGDLSYRFVLLEAGAMTQHLETTACTVGIGLCQIGNLDFSCIRPYFQLSDHHVYLHHLLGGTADSSGKQAPWSFLNESVDAPERAKWDEGVV